MVTGEITSYFFWVLSNIIRFKILHKYGLLSFPLDLLPDVIEELWLLNIDEYPHKQLLQLDELFNNVNINLIINYLLLKMIMNN
jgi:hypothetical protein